MTCCRFYPAGVNCTKAECSKCGFAPAEHNRRMAIINAECSHAKRAAHGYWLKESRAET